MNKKNFSENNQVFWKAIPTSEFDEKKHGFKLSTVDENSRNLDEICKIIMKLLHINKKGIYDLGSGTSSSFNQLAKKIIRYHNKGSIKYIDFPSDLVGKYQHYTKSNNNVIKLTKNFKFTSLSKGITKYLKYLNA